MAAAAGAFSLWLRQPVLIAYIAMGIVAGPAVLGVEFDPEVARAMRRHGLPDLASNRDLLRGLRELHFSGEVAVVAREEFDGATLKKFGAPTILYPMRNAVGYAVEALTAIIRNKSAAT